MKFFGVALAELAIVGPSGLQRVDNIIRGHFGPRELPWTTSLALLLTIKGHKGETFEIKAEAFEDGHTEAWLWFRKYAVELGGDTEQQVSLDVGPLTFDRPGRFVIRASTADDSIQTSADLTSASGQ